jgi:hypothetical protein
MRRFATLEWLKHICFVWKGFSIVVYHLCCGVLSAESSIEIETEGSGNNEHEGVFQCFFDGYNSV